VERQWNDDFNKKILTTTNSVWTIIVLEPVLRCKICHLAAKSSVSYLTSHLPLYGAKGHKSLSRLIISMKGKNSAVSFTGVAAHGATFKKEDACGKSPKNVSSIWMMSSLENKGMVTVFRHAVDIFSGSSYKFKLTPSLQL
jgi:hypothetical protein